MVTDEAPGTAEPKLGSRTSAVLAPEDEKVVGYRADRPKLPHEDEATTRRQFLHVFGDATVLAENPLVLPVEDVPLSVHRLNGPHVADLAPGTFPDDRLRQCPKTVADIPLAAYHHPYDVQGIRE